MKRTLRRHCALRIPALAFLFQLWRGFRPCGPEPGFAMSGAAPEPMVVWISALLAALAAWGAVELSAWLWVKFQDRQRGMDNS